MVSGTRLIKHSQRKLVFKEAIHHAVPDLFTLIHACWPGAAVVQPCTAADGQRQRWTGASAGRTTRRQRIVADNQCVQFTDGASRDLVCLCRWQILSDRWARITEGADL